MGKRGPRPLPSKLKALAGNPGRRPLNDREPDVGKAPTCPRWLSKEAREHWRRIVPILTRMRLVGDVDADALAQYCVAFARWRECMKVLDRDGWSYTTENKNGATYTAERPEAWQAKAAQTVCTKYQQEFGMTPSARTGVKVIDDKNRAPSDPFSSWQAG